MPPKGGSVELDLNCLEATAPSAVDVSGDFVSKVVDNPLAFVAST